MPERRYTPPKKVHKFIVRLTPELLEKIRNQSAQNYRSMNSEILVALEEHFKK